MILSPVRLPVRLFDYLLTPVDFVSLVGFHHSLQVHAIFSFYLPGAHDRSFLHQVYKAGGREHTFAVNWWSRLIDFELSGRLRVPSVCPLVVMFCESSVLIKKALNIKKGKTLFCNCSCLVSFCVAILS